jgi:hypothetical protein
MRQVFRRQFNPTHKLVALKLADCARDDGSSIFPSIDTIATETGLSVRSVRNSMRTFRTMGLLRVVRGGGGRNLSTRYRMDLEILNRVPASGADNVESRERENPARGAPFPDENPARGAENPARGAGKPSGTINSNPYGENSASDEAGAEAPLTLNALIWKEGTALLETKGLPASRPRAIIGKWCKRAPSEEKKGKLLAAIRAAVNAGTGDPVSYIEAAIKTELPAPPDPKTFTRDRWALNVETAIKFREWASEWGPRPGKPGCLMPRDLQSAQLVAAIHKQAA